MAGDTGKTGKNGDGIIRIEVKGRKQIQIGDGSPVDIDVIEFVNRWALIDDEFRTGDEKLDRSRRLEYYDAARHFLTEVGFAEAAHMTQWMVLKVIRSIQKEAEELAGFLSDETPGAPSSPKPTEVAFTE